MWKQIDGFQNYEINDKGEVRNIQSGKILKPWIGVGGYVYINPTNGHGKPMPKRLHRLVAKAFVPNPYNKPQVNHKDGDKTNNCADNLEWVTKSENMNHAYRTGLQRTTKSANNRVEVLGNQLNNLMHDIEWYDSGDIGEDTLAKRVEEYRTKEPQTDCAWR